MILASVDPEGGKAVTVASVRMFFMLVSVLSVLAVVFLVLSVFVGAS
jgi:hypothetical protein